LKFFFVVPGTLVFRSSYFYNADNSFSGNFPMLRQQVRGEKFIISIVPNPLVLEFSIDRW